MSRHGAVVKPGHGCVHEWLLRSDPQYMRLHVLARDGGVCAGCGTNTIALADAIRVLGRADMRFWSRPDSIAAGAVEALGYRVHDIHRLSLWEADHIVPVVEGGGECGLDGMRTLCVVCHRRESAALATYRADRRRTEAALVEAVAVDAPDDVIVRLAVQLVGRV